MYQYGQVNRVLVVAPLSILGVWKEEFDKFADFPYSLTILKATPHNVSFGKQHCVKMQITVENPHIFYPRVH